jgi:hypothetical protein
MTLPAAVLLAVGVAATGWVLAALVEWLIHLIRKGLSE